MTRSTGPGAARTENRSPGLPQTPNLINAAFTSDVGVDTDALQLPDGGYLYYDVTGITPSRERSLDEVKHQVTARWQDDEIAKRLQTKSNDLLGKLKAGTSFAQAGARPVSKCRPLPIFSAESRLVSFR